MGRILLAAMSLGLAVLWLTHPAAAQGGPELRITVQQGTEAGERALEQLLRLQSTYPLGPWTFTREIRIESRVIPHSHPVLTLNTTYLDDDASQLATYLHEQIHWFASDRFEAVQSAIAELRRRYPEVPVDRPGGAGDEFSTYLHLVVCWLELDAMKHLVGEEKAREVLGRWKHYRWIYDRVLQDTDAIGEILTPRGLLIRP
jgi:hypothetical protein